jgi:hypothetical protein
MPWTSGTAYQAGRRVCIRGKLASVHTDRRFPARLAVALAAAAALGHAQPPRPKELFVPRDVDPVPVYRSDFADPRALGDWVLEGGKRMFLAGGRLVLESAPGNVREETGADHLVCWLKREMPADFLLEFAVCPQNRKQGLNIVFFNTRGAGGQEIFAPSLAPRNGYFAQYHSGDLNGYHASYWAAGRGTAHIRKNQGFHLVSVGEDLVTAAPQGKFQTVQIYQRGGRIRLMVDGGVSVAWDDDGKAYGPVWNHSGWIGLRQMAHTVRCEYGYVKVFRLRP